MEEVLDFYAQPAQEGVVRLCMDERPCQLLDDVLTPIAMKPGSVEKQDFEYKRHGTCCLFLAYDLDKGVRYTQVYAQRTKKEYTLFMAYVLSHYEEEKEVHVVQDNLNTHNYGSFYENLPAESADAMRRKITFHYTPRHASWLNMAEIEFSVVSRQCMKRRIKDMATLEKEVEAWAKDRNTAQTKIHWSFTIDAARIVMKKHYNIVAPKN